MESNLKKLSIAFYWHMHQPVYQYDSVYLMPWARLHAVKDYLDMLLILEKYPKIKLNFNVVPALMDEIIDYCENSSQDIHSNLTMAPIENLTKSDKEYILNNFFSAEYETMIFNHHAYRKLFKKRHAKKEINVNDFSDQEYSDLMALFNLCWIDPTHKTRFPELRQLLAKEKGYTLKDRIQIIELHKKIMSEIIPTYKEFIVEDRIEITTSPYYHPILPILCDYETAIRNGGNQKINLPEQMDLYDDAYNQVKMAINKVEEVLGVTPKGIWASEYCLTSKVLDLLADLGIKWTVSDESILSKTINYEFIRDFKGNLEDPYHLLKVYNYKNKDKKRSIDLVFRNSAIPSLINFEYSNFNPKTAAEDLYNKIKLMQSKLLISPDERHLLTIALDGENCWEKYKEDGFEFLNSLYSTIANDPTLETVLLSDYIESDNNKKEIDSIYPGSWINKDFSFWIGDPVKNLAWQFLTTVRDDIIKISNKINNPELTKKAMNEIYIAEGSDWFWWYGEPNNSGQDNIFDFLFRERLKNAYKVFELGYPSYIDKSIILTAYHNLPQTEENTNLLYNNVEYIDSLDLLDGPIYRENKLCDKIDYGFDNENIYFRLHTNPSYKNSDEDRPKMMLFYIYFKKRGWQTKKSSVRISFNNERIFPNLKKKYSYELTIPFLAKKMYPANFSTAISGNIWSHEDFNGVNIPANELIDIVIPFDKLKIKEGQKIDLLFVAGSNNVCRTFMPKESLLSITRPKQLSL